MSEKLKPCAHCGGEATFERTIQHATIRCQECGVNVSASYYSMSMFMRIEDLENAENAEAFERWNRRHQDQDTASTFERWVK